ncbi:glycosyltransferase family 2 protein [Camelimonas abortus]
MRLGAAFAALAALPARSCGAAPAAAAPPAGCGSDGGPAGHELPVYTVIVPVYREANMAAHVLEQLEQLDYPRRLLDVKIMVEADDHATRAAFLALRPPPWISVTVVPPGAPRTKPWALNVALAMARGELVTIYDAEDAPEPDQLRRAAAAFAAAGDDLACLQARLAVDNAAAGWLPACFALEYAALFDVINPGLARLGLPMPLGGTSNHFRVAALRKALGWDAWNVTEDADLGLRLARLGWRVGDLDSTTHEEAPVRLRPWMRQRVRWLKGWLQVAITHGRRPRQLARDLGWAGAWAAASQCLGVALGALGYPLFALATVIYFARVCAGAPSSPLAFGCAVGVLAAGAAAVAVPALAGALRRDPRLLRAAPLLPFYYLLVSAAAWLALAEQLRHPARWNKTAHGVARSSRSGRLTYISGTRPPPPPADASG